MDWKEVLRRRLATPNTCPNKKKSEQELKDEEMDLFTKYYSEWKGGRKNTNEFYKTIPRFYYRLANPLAWEANIIGTALTVSKKKGDPISTGMLS